MTSKEQRLVNEAFIACWRVGTECPELRPSASCAIRSCASLLERFADCPEPESAAPMAQVLRLVPS